MEWDRLGAKGSDIDGDSANDRFGISVSINNDGTVLAVGADSDDDGVMLLGG